MFFLKKKTVTKESLKQKKSFLVKNKFFGDIFFGEIGFFVKKIRWWKKFASESFLKFILVEKSFFFYIKIAFLIKKMFVGKKIRDSEEGSAVDRPI